jgi:AhpC/TSA family
MKRSLRAGDWIRRGLGVAVLAAVTAIALGLDSGLLTRISLASTAPFEQLLVDRLHPADASANAASAVTAGGSARMSANAGMMMMAKSGAHGGELGIEGELPPLSGAVEWLNSLPLTVDQLKGKVVLVDFWTYSCINCLRALPYVRAWAKKYKDQGLVVIGVHPRSSPSRKGWRT